MMRGYLESKFVIPPPQHKRLFLQELRYLRLCSLTTNHVLCETANNKEKWGEYHVVELARFGATREVYSGLQKPWDHRRHLRSVETKRLGENGNTSRPTETDPPTDRWVTTNATTIGKKRTIQLWRCSSAVNTASIRLHKNNRRTTTEKGSSQDDAGRYPHTTHTYRCSTRYPKLLITQCCINKVPAILQTSTLKMMKTHQVSKKKRSRKTGGKRTIGYYRMSFLPPAYR